MLRGQPALVLHPAEMIGKQRRLVELEQHVHQLFLGQLEAGDRLAELLARLGVVERALVAGSRGADRTPEDAVARLVEAGERALHPGHAGQHRRLRQADVVEDQLRGHRGSQRDLLVNVAGGIAAGAARHDEAPDSVLGPRPDHRQVGDASVGDPELVAVEDPVRARASGGGPHRRGVGAGVGLGEAEAADRLSRRHPGQPLLLLLFGAELPDREHRQRSLDGDEGAEAAVTRLQFEAGDAVAGGRGARAAIALEVHAEQAQAAKLER